MSDMYPGIKAVMGEEDSQIVYYMVKMKAKDLEGLLQGAEYELEYLYDNHGYREIWDEYWSKYQ